MIRMGQSRRPLLLPEVRTASPQRAQRLVLWVAPVLSTMMVRLPQKDRGHLYRLLRGIQRSLGEPNEDVVDPKGIIATIEIGLWILLRCLNWCWH